MTSRERFVRTLTGREVDRVPFMPIFGPHHQTWKCWREQSPELVAQIEALPFEGRDRGWQVVDVNVGQVRLGEPVILQKTETSTIVRRGDGMVQLFDRESDFHFHTLEYPVKSAEDWDRYKTRFLSADAPERFGPDWPNRKTEYAARDYPLMLKHHGVYGFARNLVGDEHLLLMMYDEPALVHDMMNAFTDMVLAVWKKILRDVSIDLIECWEDMASKNGSLISPAMFEQFMKPCYRRIAAFAAENGIEVILVDCDGLVDQLTGLMADAGVTCMYPYEVGAGNDLFAIRAAHPAMGMIGGLAKESMLAGKAAMDAEIEKARHMIRTGRYIPGPDHGVLSNTSAANYLYFNQRLHAAVMDTRPGRGGAT